MNAFEAKPNLVSGRAASTKAGVALVEKLVGIPALNPLDESSLARLDEVLTETLALASRRRA